MTRAFAIIAAYRRALTETVTVRRYTGTGEDRPYFDTDVKASVKGYAPHDLVGAVNQGDRRVVLLADDLVRAQFSGPVRPSDMLIVRGVELAIQAVDDSTRRVDGGVIAYELQVRG